MKLQQPERQKTSELASVPETIPSAKPEVSKHSLHCLWSALGLVWLSDGAELSISLGSGGLVAEVTDFPNAKLAWKQERKVKIQQESQ